MVLAGFTEDSYSVREIDNYIQVCIQLTGILRRNISIQLLTSDESAIGI